MRKYLLITFLMLFTVAGLRAQVTTSSLNGTVKDEKGEPLIGATIRATHQPTGTRYATTSNADGRYTVSNMRAGGPYTIEVSYIGFGARTYDNITLKLAEPFVLNSILATAGTELKEISVVASNPRSVLSGDRTGTTTNIGTAEIQRLPTISRGINDLTRLTPQANGNAIGGGTNRQNFITIDGSEFNNNFGIGGNLPGGSAQPISLDALQELSVNVTPYDVRQSGFIGSSINAVTRSGTNEFSGSAYTYFRGEGQQGANVGPTTLVKQNLEYKQYGFRFGGPIIKNKLFFFFNAETEKTLSPGQTRVAATPEAPFGSSPTITRPTVTELETLASFLKNTYGYEAGPYQGYDNESQSTKFLARLDWNINQNHRFNIRYNQVEGGDPVAMSGLSRSPFQGYTSGNGRDGVNALPFNNANYVQNGNFYSLSSELNSTFGKFSNVLRGTYSKQDDSREGNGSEFPFVDILKDGTPLTSFGTELFTKGNVRLVNMYTFLDYVSFPAGKHEITAGVQADFSKTENGFQRFGSSYYAFNSMDDFITGAKPELFGLTYSLLPGFKQAFPSFNFNQYSVFGQDEFALNDRLKLTGGLRLDIPTYPKAIGEHPLLAALSFNNGEKLSTNKLPDTKLMFSPRFGFNWNALKDRTLQVRGGTGIFTGRVPFVYVVSQASDANLLQFTQTFDSQVKTPGAFNPDPNAYRPTTQPAAGTAIGSTYTLFANDFKMPQTWKSSLAVDAKLPFGFVGTLEGIFNNDINVVNFRNANLVNPVPLNITGYPDNRLFYPVGNDRFINLITTGSAVYDPARLTSSGGFAPIVVENAKKGSYYWSVTGKLDKQFRKGLFASLAYTKSNAQSYYDGSGDQPGSAWSATSFLNGANAPELGYSSYVTPDRVVATLSYRKEYFKHLASSVSFFYSGSPGNRFSYTYSSDFNRDGVNADLIYIPKDASEINFVPVTVGSGANAVVYTAQQQSEMFFRYIDQDKYLSAHKGEYAERNGGKQPWRNQVDFKFIQDIFVNTAGKRNTLQFSLDVMNLGNLLNKNWGLQLTNNQRSILTPRNVNDLTPGGATKPTFTFNADRGLLPATTFRNLETILSTYYMQFGLRYIFN
ncbi:MAG: carboxypeptidase regulatory-like domain-containing protein [Sphingobacteriaceae bacterium]|nr:carboxypeptidase regulatory-like domain-containing protein [Sphingobacteriaceae bacterium]